MCGIYGQYNFQTNRPVMADDVRDATRTIAHRGPDDEGYYLAGPLAFGFRRLSIIDLEGGHQPMGDAAQSVWVIFNGEIYNFAELRTELEGKGHAFRTRSDTEVIVHGYKEWGEEVFERLNGMFGLAIWDVARRKLIVARDAMGIKPVYYRISNGGLFFGSEVRALVSAAAGAIEPDPVSLNLFLRYRYTPSPRTLFKGIEKLAAGTMLVVQDGRAEVKRWYRFIPEPFEPAKRVDEATGELLDLYKGALERHLISDVPVGLLLSGGIDSALLLALMNLYGSAWRTYTVGYGQGYQDDELADARRTAEVLSSEHVALQISRDDFERYLPKVVASLEEPIAASSIVPMYAICERARQDVKVALIGQGPDELFGGYTRHLGVRYGGMWRAIPGPLRQAIAAALSALPRHAALKRGLYALDVPDRFRRYQHVFSIMPGGVIDGLFRDGILPEGAGDEILSCWSGLRPAASAADELGAFQWIELQSSLPDELLMYGDKMSMAHGLEVRVPYLDRTVVEYAQRLDASLKIRRGTRKYLHRRLCKAFLPREIVGRKKRGFAVNVVDEWFHRSLSGRMEAVLEDDGSLMYRFLEPSAVRGLLRGHRSGVADHHKVLFSLIVLEEWLRSARFAEHLTTVH